MRARNATRSAASPAPPGPPPPRAPRSTAQPVHSASSFSRDAVARGSVAVASNATGFAHFVRFVVSVDSVGAAARVGAKANAYWFSCPAASRATSPGS